MWFHGEGRSRGRGADMWSNTPFCVYRTQRTAGNWIFSGGWCLQHGSQKRSCDLRTIDIFSGSLSLNDLFLSIFLVWSYPVSVWNEPAHRSEQQLLLTQQNLLVDLSFLLLVALWWHNIKKQPYSNIFKMEGLWSAQLWEHGCSHWQTDTIASASLLLSLISSKPQSSSTFHWLYDCRATVLSCRKMATYRVTAIGQEVMSSSCSRGLQVGY